MKRLDKTRFSQQKDDGKYKGEELTKFFDQYPDFILNSFKNIVKPLQYYVEYSIINLESRKEIDGNELIREITDNFKDKKLTINVIKKYHSLDGDYDYKDIIELKSTIYIPNENYLEEIREYKKKKMLYFDTEREYYSAAKKDYEKHLEDFKNYVKRLREEKNASSIDSAQL